jgi:hypothetical protein
MGTTHGGRGVCWATSIIVFGTIVIFFLCQHCIAWLQ